MKLRDALIQQPPSLVLQRAAQAEIARLDAQITQVHLLAVLKLGECPAEFRSKLDEIVEAARHRSST
jgi:hypothetical protein